MNRRPKLSVVAPGASPAEAAAVVAAIERFVRETAPTPAPTGTRVNPWIRAGRLEATSRDPTNGLSAVGARGPTPWGDSFPWGR